MKFYYENSLGDSGFFLEKDLIKAIYTAWNIEADLYLVIDKNLKKVKDIKFPSSKQLKIVFSSLDGNEFNSDLLKEYGYYMVDGKNEREIRELGSNTLVRYDWSEVKQLI